MNRLLTLYPWSYMLSMSMDLKWVRDTYIRSGLGSAPVAGGKRF
jgi:hypothetical protein